MLWIKFNIFFANQTSGLVFEPQSLIWKLWMRCLFIRIVWSQRVEINNIQNYFFKQRKRDCNVYLKYRISFRSNSLCISHISYSSVFTMFIIEWTQQFAAAWFSKIWQFSLFHLMLCSAWIMIIIPTCFIIWICFTSLWSWWSYIIWRISILFSLGQPRSTLLVNSDFSTLLLGGRFGLWHQPFGVKPPHARTGLV